MKHIIKILITNAFLFLWTLVPHYVIAQSQLVTIEVSFDKGLSEQLKDSPQKDKIENLKIIGKTIGESDINQVLGKMASLKRLDLSEVEIGFQDATVHFKLPQVEYLILPEINSMRLSYFFRECLSLKAFEVPKGNTEFKVIDGVLYSYDLKTLESYPPGKEDRVFTIPDYVETVSEAFYNNSFLEEVIISENTSCRFISFYECTNLKNVQFPSHVDDLNFGSTFWGCTSLEYITLPSGIKSLGDTFRNCTNLKEIVVPEGVEYLGSSFYNCSNLESVSLPSTLKYMYGHTFQYCSKLISIEIPNSVERIDDATFYDCSSLTSITFPESVKEIGAFVLYGCSNLKEIHFKHTTPPMQNCPFDDKIKENVVLYVPKGCYGNYWGVSGWGDFKTIVEEGGNVPIAEITLNKEELTLDENESETLEASIVPELASDKTIVWKSADETIASVDENGKVTALKAGETTITASSSDGKVSASCKVTVKAVVIPVKSISLNKTEIELTEGTSFQLEATIDPENATDKNLTWTTSNKSVATVSENGLVSALKKGTASITVKTKDGKKSARCNVKVVAETIELESIALNKENISLTVGSTETLALSFTPENATHKEVTWSSSNEKIATVNQSGKITAKAAGETLISVETENGLKKTCRVTVTENSIPATSISLNFSELTLYVNETESLVATLLPANVTDKSVSWKSENPDVVSVDVEGNLKALKEGTSVITVQSDKYDLAATCKVTVISSIIKVTGITLNQEKVNLQVGESIQLKAEIRPENASNKEIKWSSSDEEIATISADGKVTAIQPGNVTITAETVDGNYKAECEISIAEVLIPIEEIQLEMATCSLELKQSFQLKVTIIPENQNEGNLIWSSNNEDVVIVDSDGKIEAVGTGTATITVSSSENKRIKATCRITVPREFEEDGISYKFEHDNSITILAYNETSVNVEIQESIEINGTIYSIIKIGNKAFANCTQLKKISIPASIERIEYDAFANCNLEEIHIESANPPYCNQSFSEQTLKEAQVYVPEGSASAYRSALGWRDFENIIDGTTTGNEQLDVNQNTIRVSNGILMINTPSPIDVRIYDFSGILVKAERIAGYQSIRLKEEFYILKIGNQTTKVLIK